MNFWWALASLALVVSGYSQPAGAQEPYPSRPITLVAPFPPGGVADLTARPVAAAMEKVLKNPVAVVNKTGAAGAVGMQFVATSKPDGYTLLLAVGLTLVLLNLYSFARRGSDWRARIALAEKGEESP